MVNLDIGLLVTRAWSDPDFKERLLHAPTKTIEELGMMLPPGQVFVHQNTSNETHLVIPEPPEDLGLVSLMELDDNPGCTLRCRGNNSW